MTSSARELARTTARAADVDAPSSGTSGSSPAASGKARDRIVLTGIRAWGRHGVFAHERELGQHFVVDVTLTLDLQAASTTDDLSLTVNYGTLAEAVVADVQGEPLNLIEALAERVAQTCLGHPGVTEVEVTVHKPEAPIPVAFTDVAVTLTRSSA
jgi:dihydroneopterin aldolase